MTKLALSVLAFASACSPYSPDLGAAPFVCGSGDPKCPDGYDCVPAGSSATMICLAAGGTVPDGGGNGMCADDSNLEPNNTIQQAYITPVEGSPAPTSISYAGLAICPSGDKDTYKLMTNAANHNVEALITYDANGAVLTGAILNSGGTAIANATAVSGMDGTIRAYVAMAPQGIYYVQVSGPATGTLTTNNYKLTINVTQ